VEKGAAAQTRLDDPERLAKAGITGIAAIRKTADSIQIRTGSTRPEAALIFPLEPGFDPQKNNLFEITMRTGPRIHAFNLVWRWGQSEKRYFVRQPTYPDGEFHTYLIPLDDEHPWRGDISELTLIWVATREVVEIRKLELRPIALTDRVRYHWSRFWFPEILKPFTVNFVTGPVFLEQPLAFALTLFFVALFPFLYFTYHHVDQKKTNSSAAHLLERPRNWVRPVFLALMTLWIIYDFRVAYDHIQTLKSEFRYYLNNPNHPRHLLDLDDSMILSTLWKR
jgi:hypothetical protein